MTTVETRVMDAVVLEAPRQFDVAQVPVPHPGRMEVLCHVDASTICGTDPHIMEGHTKGMWPKSYPFVPGHEWAGTIVELGQDAELLGWKVGDRVAGTSHAGCGYCRMCTTGRYNLCENYGNATVHRQYGHYTDGCFAEYVVHSVKSVFRVPDNMPAEEAAMMDTASIALHSVKRAGINPGDIVGVSGPGAMGLLVAQFAAVLGATQVIVIGRGERLQKAADLGFQTVDYSVGNPVHQVMSLTDGYGVNVGVDCAGTVASIQQVVDVVHKGGRVAFTGVPLEPVELPMQKIVLQELDLYGVRANRNTMSEAIALVTSGRVNVRTLITHVYALQDFKKAYNTFVNREDGALKVVLKP